MISAKTLLGYNNLFSPNDYKKNEKITHKYFRDKYGSLWQVKIKKKEETRNYLLEEKNVMMYVTSEKYKRQAGPSISLSIFVVFVSVASVCVSISAYASLL